MLGRCLAWRASRAGARVVLYEAGSYQGENSAAWVAAGMIAPVTEAIDADTEIVSMGKHSLSLWPRWLAELPMPVFYRHTGTLLLWHREDAGEAVRAQRKFASQHSQIKRIDGARTGEREPALGTRFPEALYVPNEAQVDSRGLLRAVSIALAEAGVESHWKSFVQDGALLDVEIVVDCRGMGAKPDWAKLRGVRGEIVRLHAPEIELRHMLRLLHARHPVYIVPRAEGNLVVGATSIESDDRSPAFVRGVLELLTSAYSLLPALAEAGILEFNTQVRPALADNLASLFFYRSRKVLRINGLYRHGFLLTPAIVEEALEVLFSKGRCTSRWQCLDWNRPLGSGDIESSHELQACLSS